MPRILLYLCILVATAPVAGFAAVRAQTEDGRTVLLHDDGTWTFEVPEATPQTGGHGRDAGQDAMVSGLNAPYEFWYDQTIWSLKPENIDPLSEYEFVDSSTLVQAMTVAYPFPQGAGELKAKVLSTIQATDPDALIIFEESRVVNSRSVECVHIKARVADEPFIFYFYLHASGDMAVQVACFTAENVFYALYDELTRFMNGFVAP